MCLIFVLVVGYQTFIALNVSFRYKLRGVNSLLILAPFVNMLRHGLDHIFFGNRAYHIYQKPYIVVCVFTNHWFFVI